MTPTEPNGISRPSTMPVMRTRPLADSAELTAKAIHFLTESKSSFAMDRNDAASVVPYLRWVNFAAGAVLYRENDDTKTSYMLLLLEGEVSVDVGSASRAERVAISVLGPGALIGEMALLDQAPRSANCTAVTNVQAAGLSLGGLELLVKENPGLAFKLLAYTARNTINRLRSLSEQLHMYDQLNANLYQEIAQLRASTGNRS